MQGGCFSCSSWFQYQNEKHVVVNQSYDFKVEILIIVGLASLFSFWYWKWGGTLQTYRICAHSFLPDCCYRLEGRQEWILEDRLVLLLQKEIIEHIIEGLVISYSNKTKWAREVRNLDPRSSWSGLRGISGVSGARGVSRRAGLKGLSWADGDLRRD